jgi:hypothetical protein
MERAASTGSVAVPISGRVKSALVRRDMPGGRLRGLVVTQRDITWYTTPVIALGDAIFRPPIDALPGRRRRPRLPRPTA